jgi:nicotinamidase-related amidase
MNINYFVLQPDAQERQSAWRSHPGGVQVGFTLDRPAGSGENMSGAKTMQKMALVIIDIQNDITKNYKDVIGNINQSIDWAVNKNIHVVYIRHENLSAGTRTFKPNTHGSEFVSDLKMVTNNVFTKSKGNALTSEEFADFISKNEIGDFYIAGADAVACVKSTCYNLRKENYSVMVLSDCITSYDKRKIDEMLRYYESKGCKIICMNDLQSI